MQRPRSAFSAVAIPARDEADRIAACLEALDAQVGAQLDAIVLLINNTKDGTADIARGVPMRPGTRLHVIERILPFEQATAGHARQMAMAAAVEIAGPPRTPMARWMRIGSPPTSPPSKPEPTP